MFDEELYYEVGNADGLGPASGEIISFPFPLAIVRTPGAPGIHGVAVFRWDELRRVAKTTAGRTIAAEGEFGKCFILDDGGIALEADDSTQRLADKLLTYLDCDNAMLETVFVDGALRTGLLGHS